MAEEAFCFGPSSTTSLVWWQPLETAPKDGKTFIVWSPGGETWGPSVDLCEWSEDHGFIKHGCGFDYATHWMPLPEPPK